MCVGVKLCNPHFFLKNIASHSSQIIVVVVCLEFNFYYCWDSSLLSTGLGERNFLTYFG